MPRLLTAPNETQFTVNRTIRGHTYTLIFTRSSLREAIDTLARWAIDWRIDLRPKEAKEMAVEACRVVREESNCDL